MLLGWSGPAVLQLLQSHSRGAIAGARQGSQLAAVLCPCSPLPKAQGCPCGSLECLFLILHAEEGVGATRAQLNSLQLLDPPVRNGNEFSSHVPRWHRGTLSTSVPQAGIALGLRGARPWDPHRPTDAAVPVLHLQPGPLYSWPWNTMDSSWKYVPEVPCGVCPLSLAGDICS